MTKVRFDERIAARYDEYTDFAGQILYSHHYWIDDGELRTFSAPYRYVWPAELDLMRASPA